MSLTGMHASWSSYVGAPPVQLHPAPGVKPPLDSGVSLVREVAMPMRQGTVYSG